ncbi:MAG: threonine/serine dehydratase, partial [Pyrinomonadaceae bacterium]
VLTVEKRMGFGDAGVVGNSASEINSAVETITLELIQTAAERIASYIKRTPLCRDETLSDRFGSNFYLKYESLQNTGAFKVRGAFNKMLTLTAEETVRGVVAVSAGNHAQAVAYAAKTLGLRALILMPESTPKNYLKQTIQYGAEVETYANISAAFDAADCYALAGMTFIHPFEDADIVAGQGTIGLEILEDLPQVTDVIVSIGGGGLSGGVAASLKLSKPDVNVWGVETAGAASMAASLDANEIVELSEITSIAKTLGAPRVGELNFKLAKKYLSGVTVVSDEEAVDELLYLLDRSKVLVEPATSCTLAAAERLQAKFGPDSHVVIILCGGNIGLRDLFKLRSTNW